MPGHNDDDVRECREEQERERGMAPGDAGGGGQLGTQRGATADMLRRDTGDLGGPASAGSATPA